MRIIARTTVALAAWALAAGCGSGGAAGLDGGGAGASTGETPGADASPSGGRPAPAYAIFDGTRVHDIQLAMSADDWQSILADSRGDDDRHATLTYDGVVVDDVGVHPSGESSRFPGNPKMSVRVKFDAFSHGKFGGLSELKLKGQWDDASMMRDGVSKFVYRAVIPTGQEAYGRVVVNGDLRGLYAVVETWNEESIQARFAAPLGPLYRIRGLPGIDPYKYLGGSASAYTPLPWEPHMNHAARGDDVIGACLGIRRPRGSGEAVRQRHLRLEPGLPRGLRGPALRQRARAARRNALSRRRRCPRAGNAMVASWDRQGCCC
jgi:hypothetical protein